MPGAQRTRWTQALPQSPSNRCRQTRLGRLSMTDTGRLSGPSEALHLHLRPPSMPGTPSAPRAQRTRQA
eukprot:4556716-Alexandrium_andersonii.AAC.1